MSGGLQGARRSAAVPAVALAVLLGLCVAAPSAKAAQPELVAAGSLLLPGLGQAVNGDYAAGAAQLGLALVFSHQLTVLSRRDDYLDAEARIDARERLIRVNRTTYAAELYATALTDLGLYSAFGAYRDARAADEARVYSTPAPTESAQELALAPFRWRHLSRPTFFVPLAALALAALAPRSAEAYAYAPDESITRDELATGIFVQHEMVAIGEEAFFRGVLNNSLSHALGETWGLAASSLVFGLSHDGLGNQATPAGATLFGLYAGYLHQRNDYEL
ncbi:MAG TPA: CPBP family intramembrane glutamic endopeptidase, partial [bacterium]